MTKANGDKLRIDDISEKNIEDARSIVMCILQQQTSSSSQAGLLIVGNVVAASSSGLNDGLNAGLNVGLHDGLYDGLNVGISDGLHDGLNAGLNVGLSDGLHDGLYDGLNAGLSDGLYDGLNAGLNVGLRDGLSDGLVYCGVFWNFYLLRYLIATSWGVALDMDKMNLMWMFCRWCPLIGLINGKVVVLPKPHKALFIQNGETDKPFRFPIMELHGNGETAVECLGMKPMYMHHNVHIPERMGSVNSEQWNPRWIADETNAEVRRILVRELGFERIVSALGGTTVDKSGGYELIDLNISDMPVKYRVLKMTCASTGDTHVLRAPPDIDDAIEAITWCNWGTEPREFESQA